MAKKTNQKNRKTRRPKREPRRNPKVKTHEHWKFKNGHLNKMNSRFEKKQKKLILQTKKTSQEKEEEEIKYIENENNLFINKDFYEVKETDKDILNWESEEKNQTQTQSDLLDQMNTVNKKIMNSKVVEAYKLVGEVLRNYTSGKLPKAFNILTATEDWEDLIDITEPFNWTPQAMYEATVQFSSGEVVMTHIFYEKYLVPAIKNDIKKNKKLNIHYYNCLKRALFKPSAFFKGIILPMSKTLSAKEASIIGSILRKCSIPNNHASAAIVMLIQYCKKGKDGISVGALFFMKLLLMKKYAFPKEVKESLVKFFLGYKDFNKNKIPVMFHQVLLCFVQHYKLDLTEVEKSKLKELNNTIGHHLISNEVNKELSFSGNSANSNSNNSTTGNKNKMMED